MRRLVYLKAVYLAHTVSLYLCFVCTRPLGRPPMWPPLSGTTAMLYSWKKTKRKRCQAIFRKERWECLMEYLLPRPS